MEKDSSVASPDIRLFTSDVKMQIRTLQAKVIFLQETGGMTEEIERMMAELMGCCNIGNPSATPRPSSPPPTPGPPKILLQVETLRADSEYTGPDLRYLLIMPGDIIEVYAYIDKATAVGFNTRTYLGGIFPIDVAKKVEHQPYKQPEILCCTSSGPINVSSSATLSYKTGQYVRVCRREKDSVWVYGLNQSTLAMGKFDARYHFQRIEWHDDFINRPNLESEKQ